MFWGGGGGWDGAVKLRGLRVGWGTDGRFQGLFIKCEVKIPGLMYMLHGGFQSLTVWWLTDTWSHV